MPADITEAVEIVKEIDEASAADTETTGGIDDEKTYLVTMSFVMKAIDPVNAQINVVNTKDIIPVSMSAEEVNTE